ncbi:MAG: DUF3820 family protein [Verrucomicrobiota bacterium]
MSEDGEEFNEDLRQTLEEISRYYMPFGKYGPDHFPPHGKRLYDLPWEYLHLFSQQGWPKSRLGQLMEIVYHMKGDGSEEVFNVFRQAERKRRP